MRDEYLLEVCLSIPKLDSNRIVHSIIFNKEYKYNVNVPELFWKSVLRDLIEVSKTAQTDIIETVWNCDGLNYVQLCITYKDVSKFYSIVAECLETPIDEDEVYKIMKLSMRDFDSRAPLDMFK